MWFGPPRRLTAASSCPWIGHPVSGLLYATIRSFKTRFPYGSGALHLNLAPYSNSPARSTKSTRSLSLPLLVNIGFQVLFHSPPGVLFTFPSRYYSLSVTKKYLALGGGPPDFPPDSSCPVVLWIPARLQTFRLRGSYPLRPAFPDHFDYARFALRGSVTPKIRRSSVWAPSISLAATLEIDVSFFSSGYLDVSVHRVPPAALWIHAAVTAHYRRRVSPFGHPRIKTCMRLPVAFRS